MTAELTRHNLVAELFEAIPGLRPGFDEISWEYEMPDGSFGYYGVVEEFITRRALVPALLGEPNEFTMPAVRFVERMIASDDDEVAGAAAISVGEPLHWTGEELARAAFESPLLSDVIKDLIRHS
jgi:hypothetical protein